MMIKYSIITAAFKAEDYTRKCIEAVAKHTKNYEHIVIPMEADLSKFNDLDITLINRTKNLGCARAFNLGMLQARGAIWFAMANDVEVEKDWYKPFEKAMEDDKVAMVFCKDMSIYAINPEFAKRWGGMDEHLFFYHEDVELQQRVWFANLPNPLIDDMGSDRWKLVHLEIMPFIHHQHKSTSEINLDNYVPILKKHLELSDLITQSTNYADRKYQGLAGRQEI